MLANKSQLIDALTEQKYRFQREAVSAWNNKKYRKARKLQLSAIKLAQAIEVLK